MLILLLTPVLRQLHWLPVRQCIEFKMAVLVYKALNGLSPQYLADDCQVITTTGRRRLRSSNVATCDVPRTRTTLGDRSFTAAGPQSTSVEQSTTSSSWLWTIAFQVSLVTENAFVWLKIAAPSDLLLDIVRLINVLTYLLRTVLMVQTDVFKVMVSDVKVMSVQVCECWSDKCRHFDRLASQLTCICIIL